jgi:hypothetical protein
VQTQKEKEKSKQKSQLRRAQGSIAELRRAPNLVSKVLSNEAQDILSHYALARENEGHRKGVN